MLYHSAICVQHSNSTTQGSMCNMCDQESMCNVILRTTPESLCNMRDAWYSYVCHDSSMWVPWLIHVSAMTHPCECHDSWVVQYNSFICVPWLFHMCAMTLSYLCHDSFICVPMQIRVCAEHYWLCNLPALQFFGVVVHPFLLQEAHTILKEYRYIYICIYWKYIYVYISTIYCTRIADLNRQYVCNLFLICATRLIDTCAMTQVIMSDYQILTRTFKKAIIFIEPTLFQNIIVWHD